MKHTLDQHVRHVAVSNVLPMPQQALHLWHGPNRKRETRYLVQHGSCRVRDGLEADQIGPSTITFCEIQLERKL